MLQEKPPPIRNEYTRLAGTPARSSSGIQRLYLGPNHLLILQLKSTHEVARRFYYTDITAIRCEATRWGYLIDGTFAAVALAIWLGYLTSPNAGMGGLIFAVTATVMAAVVLAVNGLRGPTCRTWLHTANHTERLYSLGRFRIARHAIAELHERITEAQGSVETVYGNEPLPPFAPYTPPVRQAPRVPIHRHRPGLMAAVFYLSLFAAGWSVLRCVYEPDWVTSVTIWTMLAISVLCPVAILQCYHSDAPPKARKTACFLLAFNAMVLPAMLIAIGLLSLAGADMGLIDTVPNMSPGDGAAYVLILFVNVVATLVYAVCAWRGLAALRRQGPDRAHRD